MPVRVLLTSSPGVNVALRESVTQSLVERELASFGTLLTCAMSLPRPTSGVAEEQSSRRASP